MGLASAAAVRDGLIARRAAIRRRRPPCWRAARGPMRAPSSAGSTIFPTLAAQVGEGPALLVIGDVVAHSTPWRDDARIRWHAQVEAA